MATFIFTGFDMLLTERSSFEFDGAVSLDRRNMSEKGKSQKLSGDRLKEAASASVFLVLAMLLSSLFSAAFAMTAMQDDEMSVITGQALMQMGQEQGTGISSDITFYKAGLDAEVELNLNIDKLQLGCGGVNGPGCDIDIDRLSLSGSTWADGRPDSAAILTRPFFEFAVKNDQSKTLREVVGIRMSAEQAVGMLTAGDQTPAMSNADASNGINSLSGYMVLGPTSGVATTEPRPMTYTDYTCQAGDPCSGTYAGVNRLMTGRIYANLSIGLDDTSNFFSDTYLLFLSSSNANVSVPSTVISGKRMTSAPLVGSANIGALNFAGTMAANVNIIGLTLELEKEVTGSINGLTATVPIQQDLGYIHKILVNSPFSLSMQRQNVLWPGAAAAAQTGWWMAFEDEIDIGSISPEAQVPITNDVLLQALGPEYAQAGTGNTCTNPSINCALARRLTGDDSDHGVHGVECLSLGACLGGSLPVGTVNVPLNINFPLSDLKLGAQSVTPNCWGTARFC